MKRNLLVFSLLVMTFFAFGQKKNEKSTEKKDVLESSLLEGLSFRSVGPAVASGRIADFAVHPLNSKIYYVAVASGGVWKTTNAGNTYEPVFDGEGSYSIGCVTIDPNNPNTVWVGSGENNNQRSVAYGDGIYKSDDGGKSWTNMGLKESERIGKIIVDPKNSNVVYVAAYGSVWKAGGERGIYKTIDGGKTWKNVLYVSEHTGFNEIHMDPRDSKVLYATAHQRRRQVFTYISGGPESAIYKSTDGGESWNKIMIGMPKVDIGRIGLAVSPVNPDYIYAIVEAADKKGGVFLSTDRGASWGKRSDNTSSGNYYQEIFCDPVDVNKVFYMDFWIMLSRDGGKTFDKIGEKYKHVDNHALWIDPLDTDHLLAGCDGGIYETFDHGANWEFKANLPVTQFYKGSVDNAMPFYRIYGGTQDNNTLSGPSRTISANGISNADWIILLEGDGFEPANDPNDPDISYAQAQYGVLARHDRRSGEVVDIKPMEEEGEPALRWNWDSPLLHSVHHPTRLYFGANKLYRTDNRGDSWTLISGDLTRQLDRNLLPVMGKVWSMDAVAKNQSTDIYGNLVTIAESFFDENHLVVGTDDGLIQVTTDGGKNWTRIDNIAGVPARTYVNSIIASQHEKNTFYACFNHHRYGDFKPYLFRSRDGGKTWTAIQNNLPERGTVYSIAEDHVNPNLLFAGTEFGVFFTIDGGQSWVQLKSGVPTIAVRDMAIQKRENDLVLVTFGRGFYVLDDYSPLRNLKREDLTREALLFPVKDAWMYNESRPLGFPLKGFQGEAYYAAKNPPLGAVFTYYLKEDIKTIKEKRKAREAELIKKGEPVPYPSADSIRLEDNQVAPYLLFIVKDESGNIIRNIKAAPKKGLKRIVWDMRHASPGPITFAAPDPLNPYDVPENGHLALPGKYTVQLSKFEDGKFTELTAAVPFNLVPLNAATLAATDKKALDNFCKEVADLRRATSAGDSYRSELVTKIKFIKAAILETPANLNDLTAKIHDLENRLNQLNIELNGDNSLAKREFETLPSINSRIGNIEYTLWNASAAPTQTAIRSLALATRKYAEVYKQLKAVDQEIKAVETQLEQKKAPYTPGRFPDWNK